MVIDGRTVGKLDANGTIAETEISPDVDHTIRLQRENYEPKEIRRRAGVKDMISIGGADAVFETVRDLGVGSSAGRCPGDHSAPWRAGPARNRAYLACSRGHVHRDGHRWAGNAPPFEKDDVAVVSGQSRTVAIALTRVEEATRTSPAKKSQITDLFVEKNWTAE